jgi:formylglycine-generating enzyme required for sulfatase activity/pimeloyl-ACP methyl ester carboxylesterase
LNFDKILFDGLIGRELAPLYLNDDGSQSAAYPCNVVIPSNVIDRVELPGRPVEDFYQGFVEALTRSGYTVYMFPYDWRLDIAVAAEALDTWVSQIAGTTGKVILVGHSMGGLVARAYVSDPERAAKVDKVITVGTPYLGAPNTAFVMMTGRAEIVPITGLRPMLEPAKNDIRTIIRNSPGAMQLLPSRNYFAYGPYYSARGLTLESFESTSNYFVSEGQNGYVLQIADQFHQRLDDFRANYHLEGDYYVLAARHLPTWSSIRDNRWCIDMPDQIFGLPLSQFRRCVSRFERDKYLWGDGTVPDVSSHLSVMGGALRGSAKVCSYIAIDKAHNQLLSSQFVQQDVLRILEGRPEDTHCELDELSGRLKVNSVASGFREFTVWGNGYVRVEDPQGNYTGLDSAGNWAHVLTDVTYNFVDGGVVVTVPENADYRLMITAREVTPVWIVGTDFDADDVGSAFIGQAQVTFDGVPVNTSETTRVSNLSVPLDQLEAVVTDGDSSRVYTPDIVLADPSEMRDKSTPVTSLSAQGEQDGEGAFNGPVNVSVSATDDNSGVFRSYLSLDNGQTWQEYTSPVQFELPPGESTTLQAYSVDRAGNQEYPPIMRELSFNAITGPVAIPSMISPEDGAVFKEDDEITLLWDTSSNASTYAAELLTNNVITSSGRLSATAWYLGTLPVGEYYWQVEAYNASHWSGWTNRARFSVTPYTVQIQQIEPAPPYCAVINSTYDHERTLQILGNNLLATDHHVQFKRTDTSDQTIHFGGEVNWHSSSLVSIDMATIAQHLWQEDKLAVAVRFTDHNYVPVSGWSPEFFLASSVAACGMQLPAPTNTPVPPTPVPPTPVPPTPVPPTPVPPTPVPPTPVPPTPVPPYPPPAEAYAVFLPAVSGGQLMAAAQVELAAKVTSEPVAETPDQLIDPLMRSSERFVATTVYTATTSADGRYTLTNLPPGDYVVRAASLNVMPSSQSVTVPPSQTDVNFTVTTGSDTAAEILIPAGSFQMGCDSSNSAETCESREQPLHTVTLSAYYIDKYEVTNARYKACVDAGGCTAPRGVDSYTRSPYYGTSTYADYPVINVTWHQASAFCAWAGRRLPTEAEWEKAARGSSDTRKYPWGDSSPDCTKLNYWPASSGCVGDTSRVGSYPSGASPYGVMDMGGNVFEWVNDWYSSTYYSVSPSNNPQGPATGQYRVLRGGSWFYYVYYVRSAARYDDLPGYWYYDFGFRCVRSQ